MMRNMTSSFVWKNTLMKANAIRRYLMGSLLAMLFGRLFGVGKETVIVCAVAGLFRLWEGVPSMSALLWGAELLTAGMGGELLTRLGDSGGGEQVLWIYWLVFLLLLVALVVCSKHFVISASLLFTLMLICVSGMEEEKVANSGMLGMIGGILPATEEKRNITFM